MTLSVRGETSTFGRRTLVMAVLNVTPDSFSGDGTAGEVGAALARARAAAAAGADWLDIGGESTRPGAETVGGQLEIDRVCPAIQAVRAELELPISVDTRWADVAEAALAAGADLVNDVTGLTGDPRMADVVARAGVPLVLQHIQGTPQTMQQAPAYEDVVEEVAAGLEQRLQRAAAAGIPAERCIVDPGLGFGKTVQHNLRLLRRLGELRRLGRPILIGPSRKSFIGEVLGLPVDQRLEGTLAAVAVGIAHGADIVRVHDVAPAVRVVRLADAIVRGWPDVG